MFDWEDYLKLAEYVFNNSQTIRLEEACKRDSISRAYYASYGKSYAFLKNTVGSSSVRIHYKKVVLKKPVDKLTHADTRKWFYEEGYSRNNDKFKEISYLLGKMYEARKKADYKETETFNSKHIKEILKLSHTTIEIVKSLKRM